MLGRRPGFAAMLGCVKVRGLREEGGEDSQGADSRGVGFSWLREA